MKEECFMSTFRDRFGLDYLRRAGSETLETKQGSAPGADELSPGIEDALLTWGGKVASVLNAAPDKKANVFAILDKLDVRIDTLLQVIEYLTKRGYVTKVEQGEKGNDLLRLTERGQKLAV
jgi:hypothetical protein